MHVAASQHAVKSRFSLIIIAMVLRNSWSSMEFEAKGRKYDDGYKKKFGALVGSEWATIDAFRCRRWYSRY